MTTAFYKLLYGSSIEIKAVSGKMNFIETIKVPNFLKVVSAIEPV